MNFGRPDNLNYHCGGLTTIYVVFVPANPRDVDSQSADRPRRADRHPQRRRVDGFTDRVHSGLTGVATAGHAQ